MGYSSKLEDETERRGGEAHATAIARFADIFSYIGANPSFPERKLGLNLDEDAALALDLLLRAVEKTQKKRSTVRSPEARASDPKWLGKFLRRTIRRMYRL